MCTEAAVRALEAGPGAPPAKGEAGLWRTSGAVTSLSTGKGREQESWSPKQVTHVDADLEGWARDPPSKWEQEAPGPSSLLRARGIQVPKEANLRPAANVEVWRPGAQLNALRSRTSFHNHMAAALGWPYDGAAETLWLTNNFSNSIICQH